MSFSTDIFIFAVFPLVLLIYVLGKNIKIRNLVLLAASLIFYSWGGVQYSVLLLISLIINYFFGIYVKGRRTVMLLAVVYNVGLLAAFKYVDFLCDILNDTFMIFGAEIYVTSPDIVQPIGISFFTFSILSYIIDVYCGKTAAQRNIFDLGLYVIMFPKVVSGPIVRYADIEKEFSNRLFSLDQFYIGLRRFCIGFSKKIILANQMAKLADTIFNYEWALHPVYAWMGAFSYALNIYLDFSAYSDMAIGIAQIFGFHFKENFNYPYISMSIQEFWRRWHISLSSWFRDYVYIPLGGNRKGKKKTFINQFIVFILTGLWHGANWNFIVWGVYHGTFLTIEKMSGFCSRIPKWISYIYSMVIVMIGWVFFRTEHMSDALKYLGYMFGINRGPLGNLTVYKCLTPQVLIVLFFAVVTSIPLGAKAVAKIKKEWVKDIGVIVIFFIAICYMVAGDYNPFIYTRF